MQGGPIRYHASATLFILAVAACPARVSAVSCSELGIELVGCGDYLPAGEPEGEVLCACPVDEAAGPFCTPADLRAPLSFTVQPKGQDLMRYGTYPDLGPLEAGACLEGLDPLFFGADPAIMGEMPMAAGVSNAWIEPAISPDGAVVAMYERVSMEVGNEETYASMDLCASEETDGYRLHRFVDNVKSPFVRWGHELGDHRVLYFSQGNLYRIVINVRPSQVSPDGSTEGAVAAVVVESSVRLAVKDSLNTAIGDFDVSYEEMGDGSVRDRFVVFLRARGGFPITWELYLSDLADCRLDQCDSLTFCCRTARFVSGRLENPDLPTNPAMSEDGRLIAFNRFITQAPMCGWPIGLCAQVHVVYNPMLHDELFSTFCGSGGDGFSSAVDCTPLLMTADRFDEARCPDYHCCEAGADCSTCVTIGERPDEVPQCDREPDGIRERNYITFFDLGEDLYLTFRSADLLGSLEQELHVYRVDETADALALPGDEAGFPFRVSIAGSEESDYSRFGVGPFRRLPGGQPPACSEPPTTEPLEETVEPADELAEQPDAQEEVDGESWEPTAELSEDGGDGEDGGEPAGCACQIP